MAPLASSARVRLSRHPGLADRYTAFVWLLRNAPIGTVATYAYVNPVVAVVVGAALLHERVTAAMVAGGALILGAVAVVVASGVSERSRSGSAPG
jgi:drug/metabolite transporter (DMT)-like permease